MASVSLSTREYGGHVVVALFGELDVVDAASVMAVLAAAAARDPRIIVDLAALEFIDCCALGRVRAQARQPGGNSIMHYKRDLDGTRCGEPRSMCASNGKFLSGRIDMTLRFLAIDPDTNGENCPALFLEEETGDLLFQGWTVTDPVVLAESGTHSPLGETESLVRLPARMRAIILEALSGDGSAVQ